MIAGSVSAGREAIVRIKLRGAEGQYVEINAIMGFNDELTLPSMHVDTLGLTPETPAEATLADGIVVQSSYYRVNALWDGRPRVLSALEIGSVPLIGMGLLCNHRLLLDAVKGGTVSIERLDQGSAD
jgi:predicted aspartyl protease